MLFGQGRERRDGSGVAVKGFSDDEVEAVENAMGELPLHVLLLNRVRYLTEGAAIGSKAFLDRLCEEKRDFFGAGRRTGGHPMRGGQWGDLCAVRDLKD
ncbi:hypothetical protein BH23VER1_BH23VER1_00480 [soil metagenome]